MKDLYFTSTVKKGSLLEARLPYEIKQFHWNLNKETETWMELFPNEDLKNQFFIEKKKEYAWLVLVLFHTHFPGYGKNKSERFIIDMLEPTGFKYKLLLETDDEDRIRGDAEA